MREFRPVEGYRGVAWKNVLRSRDAPSSQRRRVAGPASPAPNAPRGADALAEPRCTRTRRLPRGRRSAGLRGRATSAPGPAPCVPLLSTGPSQKLREGAVSERRLWAELRGKKLGTAFRKQAVLCGRYVVDFFAPEKRLVVEIDGSFHQLTRRADGRRDAALQRAGYRVLRLEVALVMRDL